MVINILPKITNITSSHVNYLNQLNLSSIITLQHPNLFEIPKQVFKWIFKIYVDEAGLQTLARALLKDLPHDKLVKQNPCTAFDDYERHIRQFNEVFKRKLVEGLDMYQLLYISNADIFTEVNERPWENHTQFMYAIGRLKQKKNNLSLPHGPLSNVISVNPSKIIDGNDNYYNLRIIITIRLINKHLRKLMSSLLDNSVRIAIAQIMIQKIVGMLHTTQCSVANHCFIQNLLVIAMWRESCQ